MDFPLNSISKVSKIIGYYSGHYSGHCSHLHVYFDTAEVHERTKIGHSVLLDVLKYSNVVCKAAYVP